MAGPLRRGVGEGVEAAGPAIGLIEVHSLARGVVVADAMVKRALVRLCLVRPVSPGKHLSLCTGEVEEVKEAMGAGVQAAGSTLCDRLLLPQAHPDLLRALAGGLAKLAEDAALGILETASAAAALLAADAALKAAEVDLCELRLCDGLGGKGYFFLCGDLHMVEAGLAAGQQAIVPGLFLSSELIPRPHEDLLQALRR